MHVYECMHVWVCMCGCMYVYFMHVYGCMHLCVFICMCVYIYLHICSHFHGQHIEWDLFSELIWNSEQGHATMPPELLC